MEKFNTGMIVATREIDLKTKEDNSFQQFVSNCLQRHIAGDWGDLDKDDIEENKFSLDKNLRLFSSYNYDKDIKIWSITDAGSESTTILFPSDY